jgi:hypothetical protein
LNRMDPEPPSSASTSDEAKAVNQKGISIVIDSIAATYDATGSRHLQKCNYPGESL